MKRQRGRNRNSNNNSNKGHSGNRQMESNGPDTKVRGSATQIHDKYVNLARDAAVNGNRVKAESYRQHAEHYLRLMNAQEAAKQAADAAREARQENQRENNQRSENTNEDKAEQGSSENSGRRYPPRVRKHRNETPERNAESPSASNDSGASKVASEAGVEALEVVKPKPRRARAPKAVKPTSSSDAPSQDTASVEADAPVTEKPRRRRKAPARTETPSEPASIAE